MAKVRWICTAKPEVMSLAPSFASELYPVSHTAPVLNNVGLGESFLGIINNYNSGEEGTR